MSKLLIDISHHHKIKDWDDAEKNCKLIITKITEGRTFTDNYASTVIRECEERGIPYILYHYLRKGNVQKQIDFYIEKVKEYKARNMVAYCLDVEEGNTITEASQAVSYLNKKIKGKKFLFYAMYADYSKYVSLIKNLPKNGKYWEARYGYNDGIYRKKHTCHNTAFLHQYTSTAEFSWVNGGIDLNRITGIGTEKWFGIKSTKKPTKTERYFKRCSDQETSIVDALKRCGYASSYQYRNLIAKLNGIINYGGTAQQNKQLLNLMKKGKLVTPL